MSAKAHLTGSTTGIAVTASFHWCWYHGLNSRSF